MWVEVVPLKPKWQWQLDLIATCRADHVEVSEHRIECVPGPEVTSLLINQVAFLIDDVPISISKVIVAKLYFSILDLTTPVPWEVAHNVVLVEVSLIY